MSTWIAAPLALLLVVGGVVVVALVMAGGFRLLLEVEKRLGERRVDAIGAAITTVGTIAFVALFWFMAFSWLMGWGLPS